jgi:hypothetical protein
LDAKPDHEEPAAPPAPQGSSDPADENYEPEPDFSTADPEPKETEEAGQGAEVNTNGADGADSNPDATEEDSEPSESDFENANQ